MKSKKTIAPSSNIGIASLLVIFIILCLVVFAALSLSTARNDYEHSVNLSEHRVEYYEASNTSEEIIATIVEMGADEEAINTTLDKKGVDTDIVISDGIAMWDIPVGSSQQLSVEITCEGLKVNKWKIESLKGAQNES